jgi:N-acetylmuramate 1-kinase
VTDTTHLEALVRRTGGAALGITAMPGGASTRTFHRVALRDGSSAVGMFFPGADAPEESAHDVGARPRWPFLEIQALLDERGVRVPRLLAEDCAHGWLLVEDLGDDTLAERIRRHPEERSSLYAKAATDLAHAQKVLFDLPETSVVRGRAFDTDLLFWELEHFREWGLDARGKKLTADDRRAFDAISRRLAEKIAAYPRGFTHRDYQSRNLMVAAGRLAWVDFQDALLGPRVYDLVALLRDSYQSMDRAFVVDRLGDYVKEVHLGDAERAELFVQFDCVTVQRKLKDAGRFVFIERVKGNPSFLPYVEPSLEMVKDALSRLAPYSDDMRDLWSILTRALPEIF